MKKNWVVLSFVAAIIGPGAELCTAETIVMTSPDETFSPGTPVNALELSALGIDPHLFLFTGNTMYNYNGNYQLNIIAANLDPALTDTLVGVPTQELLISLGGAPTITSQDTSQAPEPSTALLVLTFCGAGLLRLRLPASRSAAREARQTPPP